MLASVLVREPEWTRLPETTPRAVTRVLRRCLERDPRQRLHDIADARLDLGEDEPSAAAREREPGGRPSWTAVLALAVLAAVAASGLTAWLARRDAPEAARAPLRFEIPLPEATQLVGGINLSPDAQHLAFVSRGEQGETSLWIRSMGELEARRIEASAGARYPFWSPDGRAIGFFAGGELKVLDLIGKVPRVIANAGPPSDVRGATWSPDGTIVYAPTFTGGLLAISAAGGEARTATTLDVDGGEGTHRFPRFLPDGRHFLFYSCSGTGTEPGWISLGALGSEAHRRLGPGHSLQGFLPPDTLVYTLGKMLVAQRLDLPGQRLVGQPIPLGVDLPSNLAVSGHRALTAAVDTVAYQVGVQGATRLVWADRAGRELGTVLEGSGWLFGPRLSADGTRISVSLYADGGVGNIWILDAARNTRTRITFDERNEEGTAWSPDGRTLAVTSLVSDDLAIYLMDAETPRSERRLIDVPGLYAVDAWLPSGEALLFTRTDATSRSDTWAVEPATGATHAVVATPAHERDPHVSSDGKWLAYTSDASDRDEIYVRRLEGEGQVWRCSSQGGQAPLWRRDGKELFYVDLAGRLMAVPTRVEDASFSAGEPAVLFHSHLDGSGGRQYDVSRDGQRFLLNQTAAAATNPIVVVRDWGPEIRRLLDDSTP